MSALSTANAVGDDRRVVVAARRTPRTPTSRLWNASMNRDRESAPRTGGPGFVAEHEPVLVVVLVGAPDRGEPVLLVLDPAPEQVVQRAQRIDRPARPVGPAPALAGAGSGTASVMAFSVWTSPPSSCQYDQISSRKHGLRRASRRGSRSRPAAASSSPRRPDDRHVAQLQPDQPEVRQHVEEVAVAGRRPARGTPRICASRSPGSTVRFRRRLSSSRSTPRKSSRSTPQCDHEEDLGRRLQQPVAVDVRERQRRPALDLAQLVLDALRPPKPSKPSSGPRRTAPPSMNRL